MIDFKYHVTSLMTIFLALAIGILIGSTMVGGDMLVEQQKVLIDQIEQEFKLLREQNRLSQEELMSVQTTSNTYKSFLYEILPYVVTHKLTDKSLGIIQTGSVNIPAEMLKTIHLSGANLIYTVTVDDHQHAQLVAASLASSEIQLDGAILIRDYENNVEVDKIMITALQKNNKNIIIIGAETSDLTHSSIRSYRELGVQSTVDNIDSIVGQVALIFAFLAEPGDYGVKNTAQQLLPSSVLPAKTP